MMLRNQQPTFEPRSSTAETYPQRSSGILLWMVARKFWKVTAQRQHQREGKPAFAG